MFRNWRVFAALLIAFLLSSTALLLATQGDKVPGVPRIFRPESAGVAHNPGITGVMSAVPQKPPTKMLSVLFIGNSFTFYHNMPGMLVEIAKADPGNTVALDVQAVTKGAVSLEDLWKSGEGRQVLQQRRWDYVVLQDNSAWTLLPGNINQTTGAVLNWTKDIRAGGGKPILMMTWPDKPGSGWYTDPEFAFKKNPEHFYQTLHYETLSLAKMLKLTVAPVGDYWYYAVQESPELKLYDKDGHHSSREGAYLQALVFYRMLTGRPPEATAYVPQGVSEDHAKTIRKIVSYDGF